MAGLSTFDDWIDLFDKWQKDVGLDRSLFEDYTFQAVYDQPPVSEVEFGEFAGRKKWQNVLEIPTQDMRDSLMHLIVYQGDTEFASTEQQRQLIHTAPSAYDLKCLLRVMREEQRHGWQMCHLLLNHFGGSGKMEARKLLERRAYKGTRLLGAFNQPVDHWLDFFTYTAFIDRDGKYQLTMLHHSGFAPLANSMGPMLKEESFHLFTGQSGLTRVVKAGKIPTKIIQKHFNKWISTAYDLFGKDRSTSVLRFYRWGLKGRFNEDKTLPPPKELERLNEDARAIYAAEIQEIVKGLNQLIPAGQDKLTVPDVRFNRRIGDYEGLCYSVDGRLLSAGDYQRHLQEALPGPEDRELLQSAFRSGSWITEVKEAA
ncbi:MAG: phenylacetate-CoA oxygenase subunit PaaI [Deltaproteobacteria bacterium]|nr:phenylacetate-CoA oxygenase subunit PaaI [Deltaproteobacteria bacterium]MBI2347072.1 phenylacetate-CoA oxygenase subunit PaaI [Deltaproteobacteria bacterium]